MSGHTGGKERKIFSVSMVKNEADIIESFVRYHQHILDGMVFLDNMSSDRTPEILEKLQAEGLQIFITNDKDNEYDQGKKTTKLLYRTLRQFNPDIILPLDADEFLVSSNHLDHPRQILNTIDLNQLHYINWRTYVLYEDEKKHELFIPKRITYARADHHEIHHKVIVSNNILKKFSGSLTRGNHQFRTPRGRVKKKMLEELKLAHFPVRSLEQFKSKILVAWINRLTRNKWSESYLMKFVNAIKEGRISSEEDLIHLTKDYPFKYEVNDVSIVHKPVDLSYCKCIDLKYTKENEVNALFNLLENCEEIAKKYGMRKYT